MYAPLRKRNAGDFPDAPVVQNSPSNARVQSWGRGAKIPQAEGQPSPHTATTDSCHDQREAHVLQAEKPTLWGEIPKSQRRPGAAK